MPDAVDLSDYVTPTGDIPLEDAACLAAIGVRRAIIGTRGNRLKFMEQARVLLNEGIEVQAYVYLYWNEPGSTQGAHAAALIAQVPEIKVVWLDVETDAQNPITGKPADVLLDAAVALGGYVRGIYTSQTMWQAVMGTSALYSAWPLWDAAYGTDAFVPYGGWLQRAMHQYAGSVQLCGLNVDLNAIEEEPMTPDEKAAFDAVAGAVKDIRLQLNDLGNAVNALPPVKDQLKYLYALGGKPWPF